MKQAIMIKTETTVTSIDSLFFAALLLFVAGLIVTSLEARIAVVTGLYSKSTNAAFIIDFVALKGSRSVGINAFTSSTLTPI